MSDNICGQKYKLPFISNKRFSSISDQIHNLLNDDEQVKAVLEIICTETKYDPTFKRYTPQEGKKTRENLQKRAEESGISVYVASGRKAHYERQKAKKIHT